LDTIPYLNDFASVIDNALNLMLDPLSGILPINNSLYKILNRNFPLLGRE
jgi:hypothetical protein